MTWKYDPNHWPFVWRIHQLLVNYLHIGPIMQSFDDFCVNYMNKIMKKQLCGQLIKVLNAFVTSL